MTSIPDGSPHSLRSKCRAHQLSLTPVAGQIFFNPLVLDLCVITRPDTAAQKFQLFTHVFATPSPSATCYITHKPSPQRTPLLSSLKPHVRMAKKRRSLQSIFISSFFHSSSPPHSSTSPPTSTSTQRSASSMSSYFSPSYTYPFPSITKSKTGTTSTTGSPPLDYLLDDDPFANLSHTSYSTYSLQSPPTKSPFPPPGLSQHILPRSPLCPDPSQSVVSGLSSTARPESGPIASSGPSSISRALSSGLAHAFPAHKKPAFASRQSLPSLHTLSQMNVMIPKKVRKGKVGAGLPFEPWDTDSGESSAAGNTATTSQLDIVAPPPSNPSSHSPPDFTHDLDLDLDQESDQEFDVRHTPMRCDAYRVQKADAAHQSLVVNGDIRIHDGTLSLSPLSDNPSPPLSLTRSTSFSSASNSTSYSPPDYSPSSALQNYSRRLQYNSIKHSRTSSTESEADPLSLPPEFDDFSYAESYSHFLSRPTSEFDSHWEFSHSCATLRPPVDIPTPHTSFYSDFDLLDDCDMPFEPGTSSGTIRSPLHEWANGRSRTKSMPQNWAKDGFGAEPVDGGGWDGSQRQGSNGYSAGWDFGSSGGGFGTVAAGGGGGGWLGGSGNGHGGDDGDGDRRPTNARSAFSDDSDLSTSDEEEQTSTDDYGEDSPARVSSQSGTDDDVPLAQRIPTALQAQRTIRQQVLDERDQRRKERATLRQQKQQEPEPRSRHTTLRPAANALDISSSREAAFHALPSAKRPRTKTLPANSMKPFTIEDLTKRLLKVQDTQPTRVHQDESHKDTFSQPKSHTRVKEQPGSQTSTQHRGRVLRLARSFHKTAAPRQSDDQQRPAPTRSVSTAHPRSRKDVQIPSTDSPRSLPSDNMRGVEKILKSSGPVEDDRRPSVGSTRTSVDLNGSPLSRRSTQRQPVQPLPLAEVLANMAQPTPKVQTTHQRVFIGDMQRFNTVEIGSSTSAKDVIDTVEEQGALKEWTGSGGWMLWEVAQDFGMERPIREFELISDVSASWNKDKTVNTFILKITVLAPLLSPSAIPSSSPKHSGYVEWESKRGKWSKRWMELREHGLWLSKRDTGKDETFLCSLSTFDAYFVTRPHKSPKPFVFAVKSMDDLSFFENTADYLHVFSCGQKEGEKWIQQILLARSYVLHQERNILFTRTGSPGANTTPASSYPFSRAPTRKQAPGQRPTQPLVQVSAPSTVPTNPVFEPGSLLAQP